VIPIKYYNLKEGKLCISVLVLLQEAAAFARQILSPLDMNIEFLGSDTDDTDSETTTNPSSNTQPDPANSNTSHVPSPVREPDPILATCAADWTDGLFSVNIILFLIPENCHLKFGCFQDKEIDFYSFSMS